MRRAGLKWQVLALDAKGLTATQIADRLSVCTAYVRATRKRAGLAQNIQSFRRAQIENQVASLETQLSALRQELKEIARAGAA
jgi:transcriptional regulator